MKAIRTASLVALLALPAFAQDSTPDFSAVAKKLAPSLVKVEYELQSDKGDQPRAWSWGERCPTCGQFHGYPVEDYIRQERAIEAAGVVLSAREVIAQDLETHPRFIKAIRVRKGDTSVTATIKAFARDHDAVLLELSEPLAGTKPLAFDTAKKGPYLAASYKFLNGDWQTHIAGLGSSLTLPERAKPFIATPSFALVTDKSGNAVGLATKSELPPDSSWKGSPQKWPFIASADMAARLAKVESDAQGTLLRVHLTFRSPKTAAGGGGGFGGGGFRGGGFRGGGDSDEDVESATERNVIGVAIAPDRLLVLSNLRARTTARLQKISVHTGETSQEGKFVASLKDYGALVVSVAKPLPASVKLSTANILGARNQLVYAEELTLQGDKRVAYATHARITTFQAGWRGQINPGVEGVTAAPFVFDESGALVALPVSRREKLQASRFSGGSVERLRSVAASYIADALANLDKNSDPNNTPLSESDENRIAWLGVELQPLNKELARVNGVSDQTGDGRNGALVTHVYAGSPADKAGIEPGWVLLRLRSPEQPNAIEIQLQEDRGGFGANFPWEQLDQLNERIFDRLPAPWPNAENALNRILTDLGIGSKVTAEFFASGKTLKKEFDVTASPAHYESAPRFKSEPLGMTVRNLTYEVRRYIQRRPDEPGVVISKIEAGSRVSVAGIKPYEVITHVNDQPVMTVADFEKLVGQPGDLNFSVKRMATGRLVKIKALAAN